MISHSLKFIFIQIPECSNVFLEKAIEPYCNEIENESLEKTKFLQNLGLQEASKQFLDYFTFSLVRDPYERFLLTWKNHKKDDCSIDDFIEQANFFLSQRPARFYKKVYNHNELPKKVMIKPSNRKYKRKWFARKIRIKYPFNDNGEIGYKLLPQVYFLQFCRAMKLCQNEKSKEEDSYYNSVRPVDLIFTNKDIESKFKIISQKLKTPLIVTSDSSEQSSGEILSDTQKNKIRNMYSDDFTFLSEFL